MSTVVFTSGYRYSKRLCYDVVSWYVRRYLMNDDFNLLIHHRSMKRESVHGYCDANDDNDFTIEISNNLSKDLYTRTLLHELVHLNQWIRGALQLQDGKLLYNSEVIDTTEYWKQPHEIEAHAKEEILFEEYVEDRKPNFSQ